jgi:hypothetical protein
VSATDLRYEYKVAAPAAGLSPEQIRRAQGERTGNPFLSQNDKNALRSEKQPPRLKFSKAGQQSLKRNSLTGGGGHYEFIKTECCASFGPACTKLSTRGNLNEKDRNFNHCRSGSFMAGICS